MAEGAVGDLVSLRGQGESCFAIHLNKALPPPQDLSFFSTLHSTCPLDSASGGGGGVFCADRIEKNSSPSGNSEWTPQEGRRHQNKGRLLGLGPKPSQTIIKQHESQQ